MSLNNWLSIYSLLTTRATRFPLNLFSFKIGYMSFMPILVAASLLPRLLTINLSLKEANSFIPLPSLSEAVYMFELDLSIASRGI